MEDAARTGSVEPVQMLYDREVRLTSKVLEAAAQGHTREAFEFLLRSVENIT